MLRSQPFSLPELIKHLNRLLEKLLFLLTASTAMAFFIVIILSVGGRFILRMPILASVELSRLMFVWSCFFAAALAYRRRAHVAIGFFFDLLMKRLQQVVIILLCALILLFLTVLIHQSIQVILLLWPSRLPMLQISQAWFYLPLPITALVMILFTLELFLTDETFSRGTH